MNKYQACVSYHEANGFLPAKQAEEFEENKEKLITYAQTCALGKIIKKLSQGTVDSLNLQAIDHILALDESSDDLEEAVQLLTDPTALEEVKGWYRRNHREH